MEYKHSRSSVGANRKHNNAQISIPHDAPRKLKVFARSQLKKRQKHDIVVEIIKVMDEHVHLIADAPRTMSDAQMMQIIKGLSSYLLFASARTCERDTRRDISDEGYFAMELATVTMHKHGRIRIKSCTIQRRDKTHGTPCPSSSEDLTRRVKP